MAEPVCRELPLPRPGLDIEEFSCLAEAQVMTEDWREDYNHRRPHGSLGMLTRVALASEHGITADPLASTDVDPVGLAA